MLYCPSCQKMVDFNSVAVSSPTRAYTLEIDGLIDPTIIRSSSQVVNVCKNCASQNLFRSKSAYNSNLDAISRKNRNTAKSLKWWLGIFILALGAIGSMFLGLGSNQTFLGFGFNELIIMSLLAIILIFGIFRMSQR
jgi:hypothetical protein